MFGKVIYYDKATVNDYKAIIKGKPAVEITEYNISNDKEAGVDFKFLSAGGTASKAYTAKVQESNLYDCNEFEEMLADRDDYFDFTSSSDYASSTIPNRAIVKMDGIIEIPEEFDMVKMLDMFKAVLMGTNEFQNMEESSRVALQVFLKNAHATKIPLMFKHEDTLFCSKILQDNLQIEYEELSELDGAVTILARIMTSFIKDNKPYYDPLKDFLLLNRMMRKSMGDRVAEFKPIYANTKYRLMEILAIYR